MCSAQPLVAAKSAESWPEPPSRGTRRREKGHLVYVCQWKDCDYQFEDYDVLVTHATGMKPPGRHLVDALAGRGVLPRV